MSDDDSDEQRSWRTMPINIWHVELSFSHTFTTLTFYKKQKSMCECGVEAEVETMESDNKRQNHHVRRRQRRKTITTDDANQHLYMWNSHFSSTFAHWLFTKMQKSTCECGAETKMETIEWDDKRQNCHVRQRQRWKNDHDRRCQWAFVYVELSF